MQYAKLKDLGADNLKQLLDKANEKHITKEQIVQIVLLGKEFHMIYVN